MMDFNGVKFDTTSSIAMWVMHQHDPIAVLGMLQSSIREKTQEFNTALRQLDPANPQQMALDYATLSAGINLLQGVEASCTDIIAKLVRAQSGDGESEGA